jgi:hypothetical protein
VVVHAYNPSCSEQGAGAHKHGMGQTCAQKAWFWEIQRPEALSQFCLPGGVTLDQVYFWLCLFFCKKNSAMR